VFGSIDNPVSVNRYSYAWAAPLNMWDPDGEGVPQSVRESALAENPSTCVYCHMETNAPQVDHAIPRVRGGNATLENAQTTGAWCNASKGGRSVPVNPPPGYVGAWPPPWWPSP
jgi:5-methylcytosine-specific restriction endonuclease McrA